MNSKVIFRFHALQRMVERNISEAEVIHTLENGKIIENYPTDQPYPSKLILSMSNSRPIHIVVAIDSENLSQIIITAYEPDLKHWQPGFEGRKK